MTLYESYRVKINIDLTTMDPSFADAKVTGSLIIQAQNVKGLNYPINFLLLCNNATYCIIEKEIEEQEEEQAVEESSGIEVA